MSTVGDIANIVNQIAPNSTAESWDNVGLLVGQRQSSVQCVVLCLTVTECVVDEAIAAGAQMIVAHHPIPFKPLSRLTDESMAGRLLLRCIQNGIAIYSPHTAWDNAKEGINAQLASIMQLEQVRCLTPFNTSEDSVLGRGRVGVYSEAVPLSELQIRLGQSIPSMMWRCTHDENHRVAKVGIVCGSGGSLLSEIKRAKCDAFLTGEATYHQCLEADASGIALIMLGHFASEAFSLKKLAALIAASFPDLSVQVSETERSSF